MDACDIEDNIVVLYIFECVVNSRSIVKALQVCICTLYYEAWVNYEYVQSIVNSLLTHCYQTLMIVLCTMYYTLYYEALMNAITHIKFD